MISDLHNVTTAQHDQFKCLQDTMELTNVEIITARHQVTRVTQVTRIPWGSVVLTLGLSTSSLGPGWFLFTVVTWCQCYDMSCQMSGSCQLDGSSNGLMLLHHTAPQYGLRLVSLPQSINIQYLYWYLCLVWLLIVILITVSGQFIISPCYYELQTTLRVVKFQYCHKKALIKLL